MGSSQRQKGKRGERDAANALNRLFRVSAARTAQARGTRDSPDILCDIEDLYIEVKFRERINIYDAIEKADKEADDKIPIVLYRKNRKDWLVIAYLDDLPIICKIMSEKTNDKICIATKFPNSQED
ncbi:MAG: hypothetical protein QXQ02_03225 [Halobacteria archaeon]